MSAKHRSGGRTYNVLVTDGKRGEKVGVFTVTATDVKKARKSALEQAIGRVLCADNLFAHAPVRA